MKKMIFILSMLVVYFHSFAQELTAEQRKLRSDIVLFLKEEGYLPEIDKDGDIKFKKEGNSYYVRIYSNNESPFFVSLFRSFDYPEKYSRDIVKMATSELNFYKGVKVLCFDNNLFVQAEMYLHNSENFKYVFYKLMSQVVSVEENILDECAKVVLPSGTGSTTLLTPLIPFLITNFEVANTDSDGKILTNYGNVIYNYNTMYLKPRIKISPMKGDGNYTLYVKLYQNGSLRTGTSSPLGYSYSDSVKVNGSGEQTLLLSGWGSEKAGHWESGNYRFEVWYDNYCLGSKTFEIK